MNRSGAARAPSPRTTGAPAGKQDAGRRAAAACAAFVLLAVLSACSQKATVQPVMVERCLQLGGERQEITVQVPVRTAGLLHVAIRERGISVAAAMVMNPTVGDRGASPFRHWGVISVTAEALSARPASVQISSLDSPDVTGEVCLSAEVIRPTHSVLSRALTRSSEASIASFHQRWQEAFDNYLSAARLYDGLGMREAGADARTAMAQVAHTYLQRDRDGAALLAAVLSEASATDAETNGARLSLLANTLAEQPDVSTEQTGNIARLLARSSHLFQSSIGGARELPRISILEGFLSYRRHDTDAARRLFEAAAEECQRLHDSECFAMARQNLGAIAEDQQNYPQALSEYEAALGGLDESRMAMLAADISDNLGRLEGRIGLIQRGESADETAMRLYARLGDCDGARRAASTLGEMLARIGSIGDAAVYLNEATALECQALLTTLASGPSQAVASQPSGRPGVSPDSAPWSSADQARVCLHRPPFTDLTLQGDVAVFHALLAGAEVSRLLNRPADVARCLDLARTFAATDVRSQIWLENASGQLSLVNGMPAAARAAFEKALLLSSSTGLSKSSEFGGEALLGLADAALQVRNLTEARTRAYAALGASGHSADVSRVVAALRLIAAIDRESGLATDAEQLLRAAIRLIEQVPTAELEPETRAMYLATQHAVFAELTDLLVADGDASHHPAQDSDRTSSSAFAIADEGHARSIRYALDQVSFNQIPIGRPGAAQGYRELMRRIADIATSSPAASKRGELLESIRDLSLEEPSPVALDTPQLLRTLQQMRSTLVEYAAGQRSLFAFIADDQRIQVVELGELEPIELAASKFMAQLRSSEPDPALIRSSAQRLAQLVLWPVTPYIHHERVLLVPEGSLHTVPFAAMPWSSSDPRDLLLRHAEVTVLPSALFIERRSLDPLPAPRSGRFVLVGDPVIRENIWRRTCARPNGSGPFPHSPFDWTRSLPSLPGTRAEVLDIAALMHRSRSAAAVETLLGCAATPAALRTSVTDAELLHIATHGLIDARRPRLSALVLTPDADPRDDGAVELPDILEMRLHAHLVALSACDTSSGRLLPGEGVLGLAQAFLQSGAESVVASYWRVEDQSTAGFMESFYRHLLIDRLPTAAALRRAQLDASTAGDYNWAAFAVYGRPDARL